MTQKTIADLTIIFKGGKVTKLTQDISLFIVQDTNRYKEFQFQQALKDGLILCMDKYDMIDKKFLGRILLNLGDVSCIEITSEHVI